jgi:hypothetical protein
VNKKTIPYEGNPDKRIIQLRLLKGEITEADLTDYLAALPDTSSNAEEIVIDLEKEPEQEEP